MPDKQYVLTLSCPNRPGIVAAVSTYLFEHSANILDAQQYDDQESGVFFMRVVFDRVAQAFDALREPFAALADDFNMSWTMRSQASRKKVMILASKFDHCLADLIYRWRIGELDMEITAVVANHPRATYGHIDFDGVRFEHLPVTKETKLERGCGSSSATPAPSWSSLLATCRCSRTASPPSWRAAASTSTTRSCPASRAQSPTIRLARAA